MGHNLRRECARAISAVEITSRYYASKKSVNAQTLSTFFTACVAALSTLVDAVVPSVLTRVRTAVNTATITFSEPMDTSVVPALSAVVFTPARTVTAISVVGSTMVVTATGVIATDTISYTKPAANALRDHAGNQVATFSGVLA